MTEESNSDKPPVDEVSKDREPDREETTGTLNPVCSWILRFLIPIAWFFATIVLTVFGVGSLIPGFVVALGLVGLIAYRDRIRRTFVAGLAFFLIIFLWRSALTPSNDKEWQQQLTVMPKVSVDGEVLVVEGVRNYTWKDTKPEKVEWEKRTYRMENLRGLDLILEPFIFSSFMAHTMLSFDFGPDGRLLLSIEARKEEGENYNPILGGLNKYELIYLFIDEKDAFDIRAQHGHELYAFPIRGNGLQLRAFLLSLCSSTNNLQDGPRFYHIIRHNCTTAWIQHSDLISNNPVGLQLESVFNGLIVKLLHRRGLIKTDLPYEEAKEAFRIDQKVLKYDGSGNFSDWVRAPQEP